MKTIAMCMTAGILLLVGVLAFSVAIQMPAHRESEVGLLFTDRAYTGLQVVWFTIGVMAAGSAVFLSWRLWRSYRRSLTRQ